MTVTVETGGTVQVNPSGTVSVTTGEDIRVTGLAPGSSVTNNISTFAQRVTDAAITGGATSSVGFDSNVSTVYIDRYVIIDPYTVGAEIGVITGADAIAPVINATFDNSHSSGVPVLIVDRGAYLQAEWFGLDEGGSAANNNTALNDFADAVKATTRRGLIPHGTFNVSATWTITDAGGIQILGGGASYVDDVTVFNWQGNGTDPAFKTVGVRESEFGNWKYYINGATYSLFCAVQVHTSTTTGYTSSNNKYRNIIVEPSTTGVLTRGMSVDKDGPNGDLNNDYHTFEDCNVRNAQYAFYLDATQAKNTHFINCLSEGDSAGNTDYGLYCIGGSFHWYGGGMNASGLYDFHINNVTDVSTIIGMQSESAGGFIRAAGPTAAQSPMMISGVRWDRSNADTTLAGSGRFISFQTAGPLSITNCSFIAKTSETLRVYYASANIHGGAYINGCAFWDDSTNPEDVIETPVNGAIYVRGCLHNNAAGSSYGILPDRTDGAFINVGVARALTIASGAITARSSYIRVDTEAAASTDDLATINGGTVGDILYVTAANDARTVVVKDGTGNLRLEGDCTLDNTDDMLTLLFDGTNWKEQSRSNNGA